MLIIVNPETSYSQLPTKYPDYAETANSLVMSGEAEEIYQVTSDTPTFIHGVYDKAIQFRAYYEDFFMVSNNTSKFAGPIFTVSFWIKSDAHDFNYGHVVSYFNNTANSGWFFDIANATKQSIRFGVVNDIGERYYTEEIVPPIEGFVNIIGLFDGSELRIYENGTLRSRTEFLGNFVTNSHTSLRVGMASSCMSCMPGAGTIDDLRIYSRVLTDSEIRAIGRGADETFNPYGKYFEGLEGYWTFDGNLDDSIAENHGVIRTIVASMAFAPDGRLFFTEKNTGKIMIMQNNTVLHQPFAIIPDIRRGIMTGLLGITVDPEFEQNNYLYVYYTIRENETGEAYNRVIRFTDTDGVGTNMTVIFDRIPSSYGMHSGGALAFGPDGKLYASVGDGYTPQAAQNMTNLLGKILRINKDGTVPPDNPFPGSPVYSIGVRNVYGIAFDNRTGIGILTENAQQIYDEINIIRKGANYGWPTLQPPNTDPRISNDSSIKPVMTYEAPIAPAQAAYYDKEKFPELQGTFIFASYNRGSLFAINYDGEKVSNSLQIELQNPMADALPSVAVSPAGDIYFGGHSIYKLDSLNAAD